MKRRYWISVPGLNVKHDKDNEDTKEAIEKIFLEAGFSYKWSGSFYYLTYRTWDRLELFSKLREVRRAVRSNVNNDFIIDFVLNSIQIVAQPYCPQCLNLARFRQRFCEVCGSRVLPAEELEVPLDEEAAASSVIYLKREVRQ